MLVPHGDELEGRRTKLNKIHQNHIFNMHNFGGKILIHTQFIVCDDLYKSPISRSFKANHSALSQPNTSQPPAATQPPALRTPRAGRRHRRSADPAAAAAAQSPRDLWKKSTGLTVQPFSAGCIYPAIVVPCCPITIHYSPTIIPVHIIIPSISYYIWAWGN